MQISMKTRAVLVGGAALVAASAFTTAIGEETVGHAASTTVLSSKMTLGETATTTKPPSAPPTPVAAPAVKADVPCGFNSGC